MVKLEEYFRRKVPQEGYDLFAVFARFEYAMKKGGFRRERYPDAAWQAFAQELPTRFFSEMVAAPQAKVYFERPPDHLIVVGQSVGWSGKPAVPTSVTELFEAIKTARNNLFHGDKRHDSRHDVELMAAALFVLNSAYAVAEAKAAEGNEKFRSFITEMEHGL